MTGRNSQNITTTTLSDTLTITLSKIFWPRNESKQITSWATAGWQTGNNIPNIFRVSNSPPSNPERIETPPRLIVSQPSSTAPRDKKIMPASTKSKLPKILPEEQDLTPMDSFEEEGLQVCKGRFGIQKGSMCIKMIVMYFWPLSDISLSFCMNHCKICQNLYVLFF